jgi:PhzF family phenazine biosynthesis protein
MQHTFHQVDVFASGPFLGNPVAVVLGADALSSVQMQQIARWTNLSETTFVLRPAGPTADYAVRIFTPSQELPFAGHPTLGTCHAWLEDQGAERDEVVQECGAGLVRIRRTDHGLAFAAPTVVRDGPVDPPEVRHIIAALRLPADAVLDAAWVDNGPGWVAVLLRSVDDLMSMEPGDLGGRFIGAVAVSSGGASVDLEVRAFFPVAGSTVEDPVTGSLNASLAPWLVHGGHLQFPYVARQGTALGRDGRVYLSQDEAGAVWVAGSTRSRVTGTVWLS